MTQYMPAGVRVRVVAWRNRLGQVGLLGTEGSVTVATLMRETGSAYGLIAVEQTTGVMRSTFLVLDMNHVQFMTNGKAVPLIVEEFQDKDAAIMALRMVK